MNDSFKHEFTNASDSPELSSGAERRSRVHNTEQGLKDLKLAGFTLIGLEGNASNSLWTAEWTGPLAFILGGEGCGISKKIAKLLDICVSIPMEQAVESLNASVSAALISYEWKRRQA